ncbi:multidrug ABC transporter permease [Lactococcus hodotermopsidis]|uniref:Multidrug ABC transporter permease n=1 Tax=Pseudolactococcus hodotermopsidis TaxID=2709157 RepID=A0A6A0BDP8_9LACT|nr:ABC transporter permease [Lactococcus hodotermopsidis]GFH42468.1 multidrug ABC transporter permease [Lactococcus hodotermopsidis]
MAHLLKYRLLQTIRERRVLFWTLFFPLLLGTCFYFAFGHLAKNSEMTTEIPVAIVEKNTNTANQKSQSAREFLLKMADEQLITIKPFKNQKSAEKALDDGKISGIFYLGDSLKLTVTKIDLETSILNTVFESYHKTSAMMTDIATDYPDKLPLATQSLSNAKTAVKTVLPSGKTTNNFVQYFFALIAYACLSGMYLGVKTTFDSQANLSALGARRSSSPTHKLKLILVDFIVMFVVDFISVLLLVCYVIKGMQISLGDSLVGLIATVAMGCTIGVSLGMVVGASNKGSIDMKMSLSVLFTLLPSFLAGLMFNSMSFIIEKFCPIINRLNPAAVLADAFYCLRVYDNPSRYMRDMLLLGTMSVIFITLSFILLRRERYDSL